MTQQSKRRWQQCLCLLPAEFANSTGQCLTEMLNNRDTARHGRPSWHCDPELVDVVREAETDVLAYYGFPVEHRRRTNRITA